MTQENTTKKSYKDFEKRYIGFSDIAKLTLTGADIGGGGVRCEMLSFGGDGDYNAYVVDRSDVIIGEHYKLITTFRYWMNIYDDEELTERFYADIIRVYRAGDYGCIIQLENINENSKTALG